ncbi:33 kDa ribonucleoprotein, chloroplastic isoform X2 [Durio zibethinus]|uniref:33 kDa ribonucleoprotein, chloroplastic isoform X2 n=1 Tax=Durio zibethinus TaxID=66656 RepID=A0A6P6A564_DURZI|nr:33 kDa ribonucleoprotein, chloroplastic isoform X2 [Durio zibethinus]
MKKNSLIRFIARRVSTAVDNPVSTSTWRFYCSHSPPSSSSPPPNSKLFVAVRIMYDKDTGRSRGFGFVHFSKEDEARCAKDAMDGKALLGRPLRISFALEKVRGAPVVVPRLPST